MSELPGLGPPMTKEYKNLEGIGGWLLLVALGIVVTPVKMIYGIYEIIQIFFDGSLDLLTSPASDRYIPGFGSYAVVETFVNCAFLAAWLYVAFLFFKKRAALPRWYIGVLASNAAFLCLDAFGYWYFFRSSPDYDLKPLLKEVVQTLVASLIWIPYMCVSKRVGTTFVHPLSPQ